MNAASKKPDTLYLIDGSGLIFRAFHALPPMTRSDGTHVNAVYGFCNMLQKLLSDVNAEHIAVIFDHGRKTFRNEIYEDYKAHRPPPPEELIPQFAIVREATIAFGVPALEVPRYEADDLIASYAREACEKGRNVRIVSSDKDLMQLIRPGVEMFDPLKSVTIGPDEVMKKFGVPPEKVVDVQALAGDSTDNIPGVPGIGVKTAAELINQYGDLENLLKHAGEIKQPKRRELLTTHAEEARISKRLVTLDDKAPLPAPIETLKRTPDHLPQLIKFLQEQGFRSLVTRMNVAGAAMDVAAAMAPQHEATGAHASQHAEKMLEDIPDSGEMPHADALSRAKQEYELVQDAERLKWWVDAAKKAGHVAIDTETDSLTASTAKLVGISLAIAPGKACYIPCNHIDPKTPAATDGGFAFEAAVAPKQLSSAQAADILRDLLRDPGMLKIAHNLKYDMQVLGQHNLIVEPYDDTMLLSYVLAAGLHGHGLDELAQLHFKHKMISFDDVTGTGRSRITFDRVPLDKATDYAAEDADYALRLWHLLKPQIAQQHVTRVYERTERPLVPVIAEMERTGVRIDSEVLRSQSNGFAKRLQILEEAIHQLAGHAFNVGSPKQLGDVLFGEMGLAGGSKSKTGAWSTASDVLEPLAEENEIVAKVVEWRGISKLKSTYTDALPEQIDTKTGRVHTSFSMVGAATGRLSSTDPNLQNIPIRTEDGRAIRRAFVAEDGYTLLSVDYSQIELRLAAEVANIKALIQAFHDGVDIHALTASQVFGIPLKDMTPDKRRAAKAINFGIVYGISGFGLARQIGTTASEAGDFIRKYLDRFHELRDWLEATKEFAREHGYVETLFGRRVHIAGIREKVAMRRMGAERQAINAPLQGTAADIMKRAMIRVGPELAQAKFGARLLLQVHDELVFEVPKKELEQTIALVKRVMQDAPLPAVTLKVPIVAEAGHAANWAEAH
jgi:DNA polymerase-1